MHRRTLLRAAGTGLAAATLPGTASPVGTTGASGESPEPFEPLGRLSLPGAREAVVAADGATVSVATMDGFATVDVADPESPTLLADRRDVLAEREAGPLERIHDVKVADDRLAVVGPAHGRGLSAAVLFDVADPAAPERLAVHETEFPIHNCDLADGILALTGNNGRDNPSVFVDVTVDDPREVARWSLYDVDERWQDVHLGARAIHDITLFDGVAYCAHWDAGTWLIDVSVPSAPAVIGTAGGFTVDELLELSDTEKAFQTLEPPGNAHYAEVNDDGTVLAVGGESWDGRQGDGHGGPSGIDLWDVTEPASPEHLATIEPLVPRDATREGTWTTAHNFELTGDRLYSSWYQDGVKIHDVSDPAAPTEIAHWRDPDDTRFWTARLGRPGEFFVASNMGSREDGGAGAAVYTFPDRPGTQTDKPAIETPTPTTYATLTDERATPTGSPSSTTPTTSSPSPSTTDQGTGPTTEPPRSPTSVTSPGYGPLAALGGLGLAAWCRLRDVD